MHFRLKLVQSILVVHAKRNLNNEVALDLAPLVMPFQPVIGEIVGHNRLRS